MFNIKSKIRNYFVQLIRDVLADDNLVEEAVESELDDRLSLEVGSEVKDQVGDAAEEAVCNALNNVLEDSVNDCVNDKLDDSVEAAVEDALDENSFDEAVSRFADGESLDMVKENLSEALRDLIARGKVVVSIELPKED